MSAIENPYLFGAPYGSPMVRPDGSLVYMRRHRQRVRWFAMFGWQVGPEQRNVAPALAYALSLGWKDAPCL